MTQNFLGQAENIENMVEAHQNGVAIYKLCNSFHQASRIPVIGITSLTDFKTKFPYQLSDRDDPISRYSQEMANLLPSQQSFENRRQIIEANRATGATDEMSRYITKKQFVDVNDRNWREVSFKQNNLGNFTKKQF